MRVPDQGLGRFLASSKSMAVSFDTLSTILSFLPILLCTQYREHLYRCHKSPPQCPRCLLELADYDALGCHLNQEARCERQPSRKIEGITIQQIERLKSKKRLSSDQNEEARWKEVYTIIFPDEPVPSPCRSFCFVARTRFRRRLIF